MIVHLDSPGPFDDEKPVAAIPGINDGYGGGKAVFDFHKGEGGELGKQVKGAQEQERKEKTWHENEFYKLLR